MCVWATAAVVVVVVQQLHIEEVVIDIGAEGFTFRLRLLRCVQVEELRAPLTAPQSSRVSPEPLPDDLRRRHHGPVSPPKRRAEPGRAEGRLASVQSAPYKARWQLFSFSFFPLLCFLSVSLSAPSCDACCAAQSRPVPGVSVPVAGWARRVSPLE